MTDRKSIELYVSYRHEEASKAIVEALERACEARDIRLRLDAGEIRYRDSVREFMQALGAADAVIAVLSDGYLRSEYCMFELLELERNHHFKQRVFPIVLKNCSISDAVSRIQFIKYWEDQIERFQESLQGLRSPARLKRAYSRLDHYHNIRDAIDRLMDILGDMYSPIVDVHINTNFKQLLDSVETQVLSGITERADSGYSSISRFEFEEAAEKSPRKSESSSQSNTQASTDVIADNIKIESGKDVEIFGNQVSKADLYNINTKVSATGSEIKSEGKVTIGGNIIRK